MAEMSEENPCPCGAGGALAACCGRYLSGAEAAPTAEALMRSRYTAFVVQDVAYLLRSWHDSTRPATLDLSDQAEFVWQGLEIFDRQDGGGDGQEGMVEFVARFSAAGEEHSLHERSRFVREDGAWYYVDGDVNPGRRKQEPVRSVRIGRNEPCPCGSGKKYKKCCLAKG